MASIWVGNILEYDFLNMQLLPYQNYFNCQLSLLKLGGSAVHLYLRRKISYIFYSHKLPCKSL